MKCPNCGFECADSVNFCTKCGAKLNEAAPTPSTANQASPQRKQGKLHGFFKGPKRKAHIAATAGVAAVAVIAIALLATASPREQAAVAENAIVSSSEMAKGFVSSDYTNGSGYSLKSFTPGSEEQISQSDQRLAELLYGADDAVAYSCSGTMANDSFSTDFTAYVCMYKNEDGHWEAVGKPYFTSNDTTALQGVQTLATPDEASNESYTTEMEGFSSTFDEDDGTSEAEGTLVKDYWFGDESAKVSQHFTFDSEQGWIPGDRTEGEPSVKWNLQGKTFAVKDDDEVTSSITIDKVDGNQVTASYRLVYEPNPSYSIYNAFKIKGKLKGSIEYNPDGDDFTASLVDIKDSNIVFDCTSSQSTDDDNDIATYDLRTDVSTDKGYSGMMFAHDYESRLTYSIDASDYDSEEEEA